MLLVQSGRFVSAAFDPKNIVGAQGCWVADDASQGVGVAVPALADRVGALSLAQGTGSKQPVITTSYFTGKKALQFDGVDDLLRYAGTLSTALSGSIFAVVRYTGGSVGGETWASADEATGNYYMETASTPMSIQQTNNDSNDYIRTNPGLSVNTDYFLEWRSSGTAYTLWVNGVSQTLVVGGGSNTGDWFGDTPNRDNFTIGGLKRSTESGFANIAVPFVEIVDGALAAGDRTGLGQWVTSQYGITVS